MPKNKPDILITSCGISCNFEDYTGIVWSIINRKLRSSNIKSEYYSEAEEELFSLSSEIFIQAVATYDKDKEASFTTWLFYQLDYRIGNHINRKLFHLTPQGEFMVIFIEDLPLNFLDKYLEEESGVEIPEDKIQFLDYLYHRSYSTWKVEKAAFLHLVYGYDSTGKYNKYVKNFIEENKRFFVDMGLEIVDGFAEVANAYMVDTVAIETEKWFLKDKDNRDKTMNSIRQTINYYLRNWKVET